MTVRYILDTDHISLLGRRHPYVVQRIAAVPIEERATTIISADEQLQGRLAVIRRTKTQLDAAREYDRLLETLNFYITVQILSYDRSAAALFDNLRRQGVRVGTQDLRIAAIALSIGATVITRNMRDFQQVPELSVADWSLPPS